MFLFPINALCGYKLTKSLQTIIPTERLAYLYHSNLREFI